MNPLKALGGTSDILPEEVECWQRMEETARQLCRLYGFQEVRTPLIEESAVFTGSLGEAAEIVTKQMYEFQDRGGRTVTLRPEGTASIVRAFIERGLDKTASLTRLYYLGPMFRAERPQAGRKRQFHQFGVELLGSASLYQDVEVLALLKRLLEAWGLSGWKLKINSLGSREDRPKILEFVRQRLTPHQKEFTPEELERLEKNPLRILDSKDPKCQKLCEGIDLYEVLSKPSQERLDEVVQTLEALGVPFERDPRLVRGLDYYTETVFEVVHSGLGAQDALAAGGRYDNLVEQMGGVSVPAVGFAVGLERVLLAMGSKAQAASNSAPVVYLATLTRQEVAEALRLAEALRDQGISAVANTEDRPLKRQLEQAGKLGCQFMAVRGESERDKGTVTLKNLGTREQLETAEGTWISKLQEMLGN